jgi:L-ascorbate metabolism protein UlaG (beta-lactamase superfamily)
MLSIDVPEHFRGGRFFNPGAEPHGLGSLLRWLTHRERGPWRAWIESEPGAKPVACVEADLLRVTFVGHATVLLQTAGLNFLTDPIWSMRASPLQWTGPKRHRAPGIRFEDLPKIDAILLSHNHYDHLDKLTLRRLIQRDHPAIFCPLGLASLLRTIGFTEIHELDWGQQQNWRNVDVHCTQAQHFSARTPFDRDRTLWCGWLLETNEAVGAIYFAADTGFGPHFEALARRFPKIRLALLPIGAYRPEWFMGPVHMGPDEALTVHRILNAQTSVAIHYGTFSLADDGETEPQERLLALLKERPELKPFWILQEGEGRDV